MARSVPLPSGREGTAVVEYALLAALISLVIVGGVTAVGTRLPVTLFSVGNSVP